MIKGAVAIAYADSTLDCKLPGYQQSAHVQIVLKPISRQGTMTPRRSADVVDMAQQVARAIAEADGGDIRIDGARYRRLALASLEPLSRPTAAMIDAAYEAVRFDEAWAINNRRNFQKAVRAMIRAIIADAEEKGRPRR